MIEWTNNFSVGINSIDEQHKGLFALINDLFNAMKERKTNEVIVGIFTRLVEYTDKHFKYEEELFEKHGYPKMGMHKAEHDALRTKAVDLKAKHESGAILISVELIDFLRSWIENHIVKEDKSYSEFLISKNVK